MEAVENLEEAHVANFNNRPVILVMNGLSLANFRNQEEAFAGF